MIDFVKKIYRFIFPKALREKITYAREWGSVWGNYQLFRSVLINRFCRMGIRPKAVFIEVANICNARCVFCAYPDMERQKNTMSLPLFKKCIEECLAVGITEVDLTPIVGDPFVDSGIFDKLDYLSRAPGITRFHFYTNAILLSSAYADRLAAYDARFWIFCSFGGFDRETYRGIMGVDKFEEATVNIRYLIERKLQTGSGIRICVSLRVPRGSERGEFWEYLKDKQSRGAIEISSVEEFDNWGGRIPDSRLLAAGLVPKAPPNHRGVCRRLLTGPVILADGRVNACCCRDVEATLIIGDVTRESLMDILAGQKLRGILRRLEKGDFPEICEKCTKYQSLQDGVVDD